VVNEYTPASLDARVTTPTLFEWIGGLPVLDRLTARFYARVSQDQILASVFEHMPGDHPHHVALFLAQTMGGPAEYSDQHGGHPHMVAQHLNRHLTPRTTSSMGMAAARHGG
jgi:hemoglobin